MAGKDATGADAAESLAREAAGTNVLQCDAVCCSVLVLQCVVAVCYRRSRVACKRSCWYKCVAVCCSVLVLQCVVAVCCRRSRVACERSCWYKYVAVFCSVLQCVAESLAKEAAATNVLQCVAVCCSVLLQCVAMC